MTLLTLASFYKINLLPMIGRFILAGVMIHFVSVSNFAQAADPLWEESIESQFNVTLPEHALSAVLDSIAFDALSSTAPDSDNALVRVGVAPVWVEGGDELLSQALTRALRAVVAAQPHAIALPDTEVSNLWRTWQGQSQRHRLPLTLTRAVSLGRTLGARYLIVSRLSAQDGNFQLETKTLSMKQFRVIHEGGKPISKKALERFKNEVFKYETKVDALWRSALIPGWGQFYQDRYAAALAYSAASSILALGGIVSTLEGISARSTYLKGEANGVPYRDKANQAFTRANYFWAGLGAIWITSAIDSFIMGKDKRSIQLRFDPNGGVGISGEF